MSPSLQPDMRWEPKGATAAHGSHDSQAGSPEVRHVQNSILDQPPTNRQKRNTRRASILILSILSKPQLLKALIYGCVSWSHCIASIELKGRVCPNILMIENRN